MSMIEKKKTESINRQRGFTLIEILIALFIFSFGVMSVTMMQTMAMNNTKAARQQTIASSLINSQMEQIISTPYFNLANGSAQQGGYLLTWTVDPDVNGARGVHVTVGWIEGCTNRTVTFDIIRVSSI